MPIQVYCKRDRETRDTVLPAERYNTDILQERDRETGDTVLPAERYNTGILQERDRETGDTVLPAERYNNCRSIQTLIIASNMLQSPNLCYNSILMWNRW